MVVRDWLGRKKWISEASLGDAYLYSDLQQSCNHAQGPVTDRIGCLCTKSLWWSHRLARPLLPREALELMGLPSFPATTEAAGWQSPWSHVLDTVPEPVLQRIAGNGLHMACVAAVLLWALGNQTETLYGGLAAQRE